MKQTIPRTLTAAIICGVVAGAAGIVMLGQNPPSSVLLGRRHEVLCYQSNHLNSPTNMSVILLNCGTLPATPLSYYVKDSAGNLYAKPNWSVPTIPLMANVALIILIDGNAFTFQHGTTYGITLITQRVHYELTVTG
jgi:hypothetical protein